MYKFYQVLSITSHFFGENSDCYALAYEATHMRSAKKSAGTILAAIVKADGLVGLFRPKVVTGHAGPAHTTIMVC